MKFSLRLALALLMLAGTGHGQEITHNGYWWANQPQNFKLGFVTGFTMAMTGNSDAAVLRCLATKQRSVEKASGEEWKECMQTPEVAMLSYSNLRAGQLVEGLDEFYKDFLTLWKNADPDIPILKQAKAEYAKLQ